MHAESSCSAQRSGSGPGWAGPATTAEPLTGGITNRNYRVARRRGLRRPGPAEKRSLLASTGASRRGQPSRGRRGVGPDVIAFVEPRAAGHTFHRGEPVRDHTGPRPVMLERIAQSLRRIHQAGSIGAPSHPFRVVEAYALTAMPNGGRLPRRTNARRCPVAIERAFPPPPVLCHKRLAHANFIDDGVSFGSWIGVCGNGESLLRLWQFRVTITDGDDEASC